MSLIQKLLVHAFKGLFERMVGWSGEEGGAGDGGWHPCQVLWVDELASACITIKQGHVYMHPTPPHPLLPWGGGSFHFIMLSDQDQTSLF